MTTRVLSLEFCKFPDDRTEYRVIAVTNSVEFNPGQMLTRPEVEALINRLEWQVHIVRESAS